MAGATALERARLTIRGVRAELVLEDGRITLSKEGPPPTSVTFAVDQVRGTVLEPGSRGGRGWIHVSVVGGSLAPPGELAAMSDPYTLPLTSRSAVTARRLARIVEKHLHERGLPPEPVFAPAALASGRFSSGVALTRAPDAPRSGSPPTGRASAFAEPDGSEAAEPDGSEAAEPRILEVVAAETEIDERLATQADTDRATRGPERVGSPAMSSHTDRAGGWVKPRDATSDPTAGSASSPAAGSASDPTAGSASSPAPTQSPPLEPPSSVSTGGRELVAELRQLGELHVAGVLTDAEFERAKARVLG